MNNPFRLLPREEALERMNKWGALHQPFVFIINYKQDASFVELLSNIDPNTVLYDFNGWTNVEDTPPYHTFTQEVIWNPHLESFSRYETAFRIVQKNLLAGNSFLTNLTRCIPVDTNLSLQEIFFRSQALYKLWVRGRFVCFSPEIFVRIKQGGLISSYPMKGTIHADVPHAAERLIQDSKEAAEHATIVDLIRNDLSMHATGVHVNRYRYFDTLATNRGTILQTSSEIVGQLPSNYRSHLGTILFDMLPAGSITGAPKQKTMEIIEEAEGYERGFYTGVAGCFDGDNLDSGVLIRFIEEGEDGQLYFKAGGGITYQSDARSEYDEVIQKTYVPIY